MEILGGENARPRELGVSGHVGEELGVPVGERADLELLLQGRQPSWSVGPWVQEVPLARQREQLFSGPEAVKLFGFDQLKERRVLGFTDGDEGRARIVCCDELAVSLIPFLRKVAPGGFGGLNPDGVGDGCRP